jgi:hypothetical protein
MLSKVNSIKHSSLKKIPVFSGKLFINVNIRLSITTDGHSFHVVNYF